FPCWKRRCTPRGVRPGGPPASRREPSPRLRSEGSAMATEPDTLSVTIFGSEYKIKGADPDYIGEVAKYVDAKMRELERRLSSGSPAKIAILTSLNIADELFRQRNERERLVTDLKGKARNLGSALDACLREE